ncbi:MAG: TerB family tellurite resistance protein [Pseudomonadota bacterium]
MGGSTNDPTETDGSDADFMDPVRREARAACGAYLMVAFADGVFDRAEEARFLDSLANNENFKAFPAAILQNEYNALLAAIKSDYAATSGLILDDIAWLHSAGRNTEAVRIGAQAAIVADTRLEPQEEAALDQIEQALGLSEGAL